MDIIKLVYPGLGLSCAVILLLLGFFQFKLYWTKGYERSKALAIFCILTSLFAFNITVVYSNSFSAQFIRFYVEGFQFVLFLSLYYYQRSLSFFISIPRKLKTFYSAGVLTFSVMAVAAYIWYLATGQYLYFDPNVEAPEVNYFVNTYTDVLGRPSFISLLVFGASGLLSVILTSVVLWRLRRSSSDIFLMMGMIFTLVASIMDNVLLPIAPHLYIPLLFLSNIFEAFRMCYLATIEDYVDSGFNVTAKELKQSQHNMSIDEEQLERLSRKLVDLMEEEHLYKDPMLKLETLGKKLKIPSYIVSQVLRFGLQTNFNSLVGKYRIDYVKEKLKKQDNFGESILDIATEAGFNSKSSFNLIFKKHTGQTPSQYRKKRKTGT